MGAQPLSKIAAPAGKWAILLGNEGHGVSNSHLQLSDQQIAVPGEGLGESLNVAVAGAILFYHFTQIMEPFNDGAK